MVSCRQPLVVRKKMQQSLVRGPQRGICPANDITNTARDDAEGISARGHDANDEIVLNVEDLVGVEGAFVGFDPQLGLRDRVCQLHGDAQPGASLPDAAVDQVASRLLTGAGADDTKIAERVRPALISAVKPSA